MANVPMERNFDTVLFSFIYFKGKITFHYYIKYAKIVKKILKHTFKQLSKMYFVLSSSTPSFTNVFHPQDMGDFTRVSYPQVNHPFPLPSDGA